MPEIMTATQLIHAAAGSPPYPADVAGHCRLCGAEGSGLPFAEWVKPTFTNWDLLRPGTIVCTACQFCTEHTSALLQARTGKDKPQRMVNYSHFVVGSEWLPLHKGQKAQMLAALRSSPAVAVWYPGWLAQHPEHHHASDIALQAYTRGSCWTRYPSLAQHLPVPSALGPRSTHRQSPTYSEVAA